LEGNLQSKIAETLNSKIDSRLRASEQNKLTLNNETDSFLTVDDCIFLWLGWSSNL